MVDDDDDDYASELESVPVCVLLTKSFLADRITHHAIFMLYVDFNYPKFSVLLPFWPRCDSSFSESSRRGFLLLLFCSSLF